MPRARRRNARRRPGFTLVEMLVVIAIISVLVSLTAVAVFRLIGNQQSANTRSELSRIQGELQKQWRSAADKIVKEPIPSTSAAYYGPSGNGIGGILQMATPSGSAPWDYNRARVIWVKLRLKQTFPQTFNEVLNPAASPLPPNPTYYNALTALGYNAGNTTVPQPWESSVLLLMALQRGEEGGGVKMEDLGVSSFIHDFQVPAAVNPQQPTIKGLVDAWGEPIVFSRWPVNSTVLNPNGQPQNGDKNDPGDPSGLLVSTAWQTQNASGYTQFKALCHAVPPHQSGEATTYRIFPLVASSGPDKTLGLDPITFQQQPGNAAADNVYPNLFPDK